MKRIAASKVMGIAIGPSGLWVAELSSHKGRQELLHTLALEYAKGVSLEEPLALGKALQQSLRQAHFSAREVVVGLPARVLVTRRKELPPLTAETAAGTLRLYAEGEFGGEYRELAMDYAGEPATDAPRAVLLVATNRSLLEQCRQMVEAAGLRLAGVTTIGGAMAWATARAGEEQSPALACSPLGAELVLQHEATPTHLRHLMTAAAPDISGLAGELRRALAGLPPLAPGASIVAWGLDGEGSIAELAKRSGAPIRQAAASGLLGGTTAEARQFLPAIAVALAALEGAALLDFTDSRLTPPPAVRSRRPAVWAGALAATLMLAAVVAVLDLRQLRAEVADSKARLDAIAPEIAQAETAVARRKAVQSLSGGSPLFVACLSQLTQAFPDDGSIWLTSLSLRQNMTGQMSGKATGEQQVLGLLDRLTATKRLGDLKLLEVREAGRNGREVTFAISFTFKPGESKP